MRPSSPGLVGRVRRGRAPPGRRRRRRSGWPRPTQLYFASGSLALPGAMFTASHNPAQYNGIKMCRAGACPIGQDTGLADDPRPRRRPGVPPYRRTGGHRRPSATCSRPTPSTCARSSTCAGNRPAARSSSTPATAWPGTPCPPCFAGPAVDLVPMYFELDGTFPNHEANPLEPGQPASTCRRAVRRAGGRHRPGLRRRRRPLLRRRRARRAGAPVAVTALVAVARAGQAPRLDGDPQPDHLAGRARDRRRARRHAGPHPGRALVHQGRDGRDRRGLRRRALRRTTTSATSGAPTPGCWRRCTCWPPWPSQDRPLSELRAAYERYVASGEINAGRRPGGVPPGRAGVRASRDGVRSTTSTG